MGTGGSVCIPVGKHDSKASLLGGNSRQKGQQSAFWKALPARPYFTQTYCSLLNLAWLDYYLPAMHVRSIAGRRRIGRNRSTKGLHPLFSSLFAKDKYSPYLSWQSPACLLLNITRSVLALRHGKKWLQATSLSYNIKCTSDSIRHDCEEVACIPDQLNTATRTRNCILPVSGNRRRKIRTRRLSHVSASRRIVWPRISR